MFELTPFAENRSMDVFSPFHSLADFERDFFSGSSMGSFAADIHDNGDAFVLKADLPGMKKAEINIDIDGDRLSITAQRNTSKDEKDSDGNIIRRERYSGSFSRSFDVSNIRTQDITASYEDGVLTLQLPKKEAEAPTSRRLEIH